MSLMIVSKSEFEYTALIEPDVTLLQVWNRESYQLTPDVYKKIIGKYRKDITIHKPVFLITDLREFNYTIPHEIRKWHEQAIFDSKSINSVKKNGMIMSSDLLVKITIKDVLARDMRINLITRYFDNMEDCINWLNENP